MIEGALMVLGGLIATAYGYGVVSPQPRKPTSPEQIQRYLRFFRWGGPFLVLFGVLMMVGVLD